MGQIAEEVVVLEAKTAYIREIDDAVRRRVLRDWCLAFEDVPGAFARWAFLAWNNGARMPNPNELADCARALMSEAHDRIRAETVPRPVERPFEPDDEPVLSPGERLELIRARLEAHPDNQFLRSLEKSTKAEIENGSA